jgi:signal peptidase I
MESEITSKKRNPFIAALLSLITPGLGQVYNGQLLKGLAFYLGNLILTFLYRTTGLAYQLLGLISIATVALIYCIIIIGDAGWTAYRTKDFVLKPYNRGYLYFLIILLTLISTFAIDGVLFREKGIKEYKMPSGSMEPTIEVGDRFVVALGYYPKNKMKRGDIIIFVSPDEDSKIFVKRIAGLPGDVVEIRNKILFINGDSCSEPYVCHLDPYVLTSDMQPRDNFGPDTIPENKVFVLGDNRDNSRDSRFFGNIDVRAVRGKALYLYWPLKQGRWGKIL